MTSHGLNVSTERLETLFWTSRLGLETRTITPIVSVSSRSRHHTSRLQPCLDQVKDFKFLSSYKSADGDCTNDIKIRIAMARQKVVELTTIWKDKNVTSALKIRVMKSMVWALFQYGVDGWTLKKSDRNRIESFEMWCWRKMLGISWKKTVPIYQY